MLGKWKHKIIAIVSNNDGLMVWFWGGERWKFLYSVSENFGREEAYPNEKREGKEMEGCRILWFPSHPLYFPQTKCTVRLTTSRLLFVSAPCKNYLSISYAFAEMKIRCEGIVNASSSYWLEYDLTLVLPWFVMFSHVQLDTYVLLLLRSIYHSFLSDKYSFLSCGVCISVLEGWIYNFTT